jgi:hypothetical protein
MKAGAGKRKGGNYERQIAKRLSLWITQGKNENGLWRSSSSGATATIGKKKGEINPYQCGDLCAVSPDCYNFAEKIYVEIKSYKQLNITNFIFNRPSILEKFWKIALQESKDYNKEPIIVAKENNFPELIIFRKKLFDNLLPQQHFSKIEIKNGGTYIAFLDEFLKCFILKPKTFLDGFLQNQ